MPNISLYHTCENDSYKTSKSCTYIYLNIGTGLFVKQTGGVCMKDSKVNIFFFEKLSCTNIFLKISLIGVIKAV